MKGRLSLQWRFLIVAILSGFVALSFAAWSIGGVIERVVRRNLGEKLDTQIVLLDRAVTGGASFDESRLVLLPGFDRRDAGWGWRVEAGRHRWQGGTPIGTLEHRHDHHRESRPHPGSGRAPDGARLYVRQQVFLHGDLPVTIVAAGPQAVVDRPLHVAIAPFLLSLALLGGALMLASWAQLRIGLHPLRSLRDAVARVRKGEAEHLPEDQPEELLPIVSEVNALIDQNAAGLSNARTHVANLAHGLKTPLATLALRLEREGASAESRALVAQLDKRIAHHLRRARSAATGKGDRARCDAAEVAADLVLAMTHIHAGKGLTIDNRIGDACVVNAEHEDMEELLGNLLDNACRHASKQVRIGAESQGRNICLTIEDDGPGIAEMDMVAALHPGTRLDETVRGYGFGLGIVRELAELYGGSLALSRSSDLGGLMAKVCLTRKGEADAIR